MAREILLYMEIFDFTAERFIEAFEESKDEDIVVRVSTPGGNVLKAWGMIAKVVEHPNNVEMRVDGLASSMGFYMLPYADNVRALNVSRFAFHRAAMDHEEDLNDAERKELNDINADLRKAIEGKIDEGKLKALKGVTLDEIFDPEKRVTVTLSAEEAKKIGLVDEVFDINQGEITAIYDKIAAFGTAETIVDPITEPVKKIEKSKNKTMDINKLRAEHPEVYKAIFESGVKAENDRIGSWMAFNDIDPKAVAEGVKSGEAITATATATFSRKAMNPEVLARLEKDAAAEIKTEELVVKKEGEEAKAEESKKFLEDVKKDIK